MMSSTGIRQRKQRKLENDKHSTDLSKTDPLLMTENWTNFHLDTNIYSFISNVYSSRNLLRSFRYFPNVFLAGGIAAWKCFRLKQITEKCVFR